MHIDEAASSPVVPSALVAAPARARREPMPGTARDLSEALSRLAQATEDLRATEQAAEEARERFRQALVAAHGAGASYGLLGRVVGLSRQRVARIVAQARER